MLRTFFLLPLLFGLVFLSGCSSPKQNSRLGEVHYTLGLSYLGEQNPTLALREFLVAEAADPGSAGIQEALAHTYQLKKAFPEAETHYLRALELKPADPTIQNNLGALYLDMKRWDDAIAYFRKASANLLFVQPEISLTGMGVAYYQKGDYLDAVAACKKALECHPAYAPALFRLGETYYALGKAEMAIAQLAQVKELAPDYAPVYYQLGLAYVKNRETKKALDAFGEVLRLAPGSENARHAADYIKLIE